MRVEPDHSRDSRDWTGACHRRLGTLGKPIGAVPDVRFEDSKSQLEPIEPKWTYRLMLEL
jgi:hypothetical protein